MNLVTKLIRADSTRKTRFHTCRGELCLNPPDAAFALATTAARHLFGRYIEIPWIALPAYRFLKKRLNGGVVFEYSSGMSTLWFARRCRRVYAVEDNSEWYETIRDRTAESPNTTILFETERERYVRSIDTVGEDGFDVISIDGSHRPECFEHARSRIKPGGIILIDNTDTEKTAPILATLDRQFAARNVHRFAGFPPGNFHPTETTICVEPGA